MNTFISKKDIERAHTTLVLTERESEREREREEREERGRSYVTTQIKPAL